MAADSSFNGPYGGQFWGKVKGHGCNPFHQLGPTTETDIPDQNENQSERPAALLKLEAGEVKTEARFELSGPDFP